MMYGAIDLHLRYSQIRIVDEAGRAVREKRVVTSREALTAAVAGVGDICEVFAIPVPRLNPYAGHRLPPAGVQAGCSGDSLRASPVASPW